jgi:hypothetical protein
MGAWYQGKPICSGVGWIFPNLGLDGQCGIAAKCPWYSQVEANTIWYLQQQISLWCVLPWFHSVWSLEKNLEDLGAYALPFLHMVGNQQQMLDRGPTCQARFTTLGCLYSLWPRWGINFAHSNLLCLHLADLAYNPATLRLGSSCTFSYKLWCADTSQNSRTRVRYCIIYRYFVDTPGYISPY